MSMRDFLARVPTPSFPPLAPVTPVVEAKVARLDVRDRPPDANKIAQLDTVVLHEDDAAFYWDVETRSVAKLGKGKESVGARAYAEHPSTEVICVSFARGNGPVETWIPGQPIPETVLAAAADLRCSWVAHNAAFERAILEHILIPRHGWPMVPVVQHVCTMTLALANAYPGSLEGVAEALGLVNRKDAAREKIVRVMWKPRKPRRGEDPTKIYWVDSSELRAELYAYNKQDVATERELHQRLPTLPAAEQDVWVIDAEINDLGVYIDAPLAAAASRLEAQALTELNTRMRHDTDGAVDAATKTEKLKAWLKSQGVELPHKLSKGKPRPSLDANDIENLLAGDLPNAQVRAALEIRVQAAQSAASKI